MTRMVTRTVEEAEATVMVVHPSTQTVENIVVNLGGVIDEKQVVKHLNKTNTDPDTIFVQVVSYKINSTLYGMPESEFITLAKVLPPRKTYN